MTTLASVIQACTESGTLLIAFCALVVVPFLVWTLSRLSLPLLGDISNDRSRALTSGLLAIAPGASFAIASSVVIARAIRAGCLDMPGGRVVVTIIALLLGLAFARASLHGWRRQRRVDDLIGTSTPAAPRLGSIAADANVPVLEIAADEPLIFVAGFPRPSIFVSSGALGCLNDSELRAALAHERAHARHGDQLIMSAVLFCADLIPLNVEPLTAFYRDAREFAADRAALETADPIDLASAILNVVSQRRSHVAALADACVKARLSWLLNGATMRDRSFPTRLKYLVAAQLTLLATLAIAAIILPSCRIIL